MFTTMVHTKSRQLLMSHELKVYSCDPPCNAPAGVESLLTLVLAYVNAQTPYFKDEYLPPGYMAHEPFAEASVNGLLRNEASEVVPTMGQLMRILMDKLGAPAELEDHTGARNSRATSHLRAQMAFLRISTVKAYLAPASGQQNRQWKRIDERLRWLNGQERLFQRAYFQLCMMKDKELFGRRRIGEIDVESIVLPSDEEVQEKLRNSDSGEN
ncbi:hypothetical protein PCANC_25404 [Puccinia coronata f. sp. avenae]|uniref:Uncharacterized protein n=1 Tax=Puccinia coronata f. sp. avenae TaxID=200324 RepID=A0A2N5TKX3_9BASI|nr:hypothetical protein PCANC_25404 [Puccinia coronata f. sp. avenae]